MIKLYIFLAALHSLRFSAYKQQRTFQRTSRVLQNSFSLFGTMTHGVKKENLPTKICVTCNRPFTWRKKWERCWDEVTTCSKGCNAKRRVAKKEGSAVSDDDDSDDEEDKKNSTQKKGAGNMKYESKMAEERERKETIERKENIEGKQYKPVPIDEENSNNSISKNKSREVDEDEEDDEDDNNTNNVSNTKEKNVKSNKKNGKKGGAKDEENEDNIEEVEDEEDEEKEVVPEKRMSRKKLQKLKLKEIAAFESSKLKGGLGDSDENIPKNVPTERTKTCAVCKGEDVLMFRCQWDASKQWRFVCKPCWPSISGAASSKKAMQDAEGNYKSANPLYNYGGTWKGRGRAP